MSAFDYAFGLPRWQRASDPCALGPRRDLCVVHGHDMARDAGATACEDCGMVALRKRVADLTAEREAHAATRRELEDTKEELQRLQRVHLHGCECTSDEACLFARERDAALRSRACLLRALDLDQRDDQAAGEAIAKLMAKAKELKELRERVAAALEVLARNGCDCECAGLCGSEHDDDCVRCLGCRIESALTRGERR